jgi:NAD(P)-dependent dehydrogenase (short-subunit alcohol dehydrogenase family)
VVIARPTSNEPGRAVLVTGASRGLGLEIALTLAARGFRVWAGVRSESAAAAVAAAGAGRRVGLEPVLIDVTDPASMDRAFERVAGSPDPLYAVVNNAGITLGGYFEDLTEEEIRRVIDVNVFGAMSVTRRALPLMRAAGRGRLVMMSSLCGRIGSVAISPYVASKFALEGWSESLALEVTPFGIQVVLIEPGIVPTEFFGVERRTAKGARTAESPYFNWFRRAELEADALVRNARITPADVADAVHRALVRRRPALRYGVGRRATLLMSLRRHLPGELFERLYFGEIRRRVTGAS